MEVKCSKCGKILHNAKSIERKMGYNCYKNQNKKNIEIVVQEILNTQRLVLEKLQNLTIRTVSSTTSFDKLKLPRMPDIDSKEKMSMKECMAEMKNLFEIGTKILNKVPEEEIANREIREVNGKKIAIPSKKERIEKYLKKAEA